ncbi:MAG: hypothetical protein WCK16_01720 [Candidatus Moraniibacteriota bacterium]
MKKILAMSLVLFAVVFLAGCGQQSVSQTRVTTPAPVVQQGLNKSDNKTTEWKNFSFNGDALSFKYPTQWCFDNKDCRNLYVTRNGDDISISQAQNQGTKEEYIEPMFSISYLDGVGQEGAEKYLKNKYKLTGRILWTTDKVNPDVKIAELKNFRTFAAFSQNLGILFSFSLQPACLFDCQIDGDILNSIKLDEVSFYRE